MEVTLSMHSIARIYSAIPPVLAVVIYSSMLTPTFSQSGVYGHIPGAELGEHPLCSPGPHRPSNNGANPHYERVSFLNISPHKSMGKGKKQPSFQAFIPYHALTHINSPVCY